MPRCRVGKGRDTCYMVAYTPAGDPVVEAIMSTLAFQNGLTSDDILSFATESESDNFLRLNPNTTQGVYQFSIDYGCTSVSTQQAEIDACFAANHTADELVGIKYIVQYNRTSIYNAYDEIDTYTGIYLPYVNAVERAIFATFGSNMTYDFTVSKMAHPALPRFNIVATVGPSVIFAALMFNLVIQAGMIVAEKELKLRESMRVMGLIDGVYWLSWIVLNIVVNIIAAFLLIIAGQIFRLPMFTKNDFGTYAVLLILFALAMVPLGLLLSVLVDKASTATTAGFAAFLIGTLIQSFSPILYDKSSGLAAASIFSLFPFVVFGKGLADLASATTNEYQPGLRWSDRFDNQWWPLQRTYYFLIADFFIYLIIALYLDNILYSKRPFYFLFSPTYWRGAPRKVKPRAQKNSGYDVDDVDSDVAAEEIMIKSGQIPASKAVVLDQLSMTYSTHRYMCCGKVTFRAVKDVRVALDDGQLFCLLGHNGAGKSTTIGMLTGLLTPTGGDATIFGNSIITNMDQIRESMGVCPQHDVLWPQLTAYEHLELYAGFKQLYYADMKADVAQRLADVALTAAANTPSGNYSGGMKRRLSVSIALIGDPKIVFLDEPTTGMDPVSRRQVWNLIERVKRGRVTLLTTHSMEEADVLGDRIAIMKGGRLAALGSSLHLKRKFGDGYHVTVLSQPEMQEELNDHVLEFFEDKPLASHGSSSNSDITEIPSNRRASDSEDFQSANGSAPPSNKAKSSSKKSKNVEVLLDSAPRTEVVPGEPGEDDGTVKRLMKDGMVSQFQIPLAYHNHLPEFFRSLTKHKKDFGIADVQLAMTSLEDVFLRVAEKGEASERKTLTKEEKWKKTKRKMHCIFWPIFVFLLLLAIAISVPLALSGKDWIHPTPVRTREPLNNYQPTTGALDTALFPAAIQVSDVSTSGAIISAWVTSPGLALTARLVRGENREWVNDTATGYVTRDVELTVNSNGRVHQVLAGLQADTVYNVWVEAANGSRSGVSRFRTATPTYMGIRNITLGATSAFGMSAYPYRALTCVGAKKLDAFLLLGDLVYANASDDLATRMEAYNRLITSEGFLNLTQTTSFIATWNDHEVQQGWKQPNATQSDPELEAQVSDALTALTETFPHIPGPGAGNANISSQWRTISWGENLDVFVLDLQYERNATQLMSEMQFQWLLQSLNTSKAHFKVIMSSITFTDTTGLLISVPNSWISAPEAAAQRAQLVKFITDRRITGVLFISGGSLYGLISHAESTRDPDDAPAWSSWNITETVVGPVGTYVNPQVQFNARLAYATEQFIAIADTYNAAMITLDPGSGWIDVQYYDENCLIAYSEAVPVTKGVYGKAD